MGGVGTLREGTAPVTCTVCGEMLRLGVIGDGAGWSVAGGCACGPRTHEGGPCGSEGAATQLLEQLAVGIVRARVAAGG